MRGLYWDLHVVPIGDGADAEQKERRAHQLVRQAPQEGEMVGGEGGEDGRGVRGHPVAAPVVLVEHESIPVHEEHDSRAEEGPEVLGQQVERNLPAMIVFILNR